MNKWTRNGDNPHTKNLSFKESLRRTVSGLSPETILKIGSSTGEYLKTFGQYLTMNSTKETMSMPAQPRVCIYVGHPNTPFSEYSIADLKEKAKHYWRVTPDTELSLSGKQLLVLPCPVRELNASELSNIKTFLRGNRRVIIFSGDYTITSNILRQLDSKLDVIWGKYIDEKIYTQSGLLTDKSLFWIPIEITGQVTVRKDYWSDAAIKDFMGVGLLHQDVVTLIPAAWTIWLNNWSSPLKTEYMYCEELATAIDDLPEDEAHTEISWDKSPEYTEGYMPDYSLDIHGLGDWIKSNEDKMPMYYIREYGYVQPTSSETGIAHWTFVGKKYREFVGSFMAYRPEEKIIVASFKPTWMTLNYNVSDIDYWFPKLKKLSNWIYSAKLANVDIWEDGGFWISPPAYIRFGADGSGALIQS